MASKVDNMNKIKLHFDKYRNISRLALSHLHIHVRTIYFDGLDSFLPLLNNLTLFDLRHSPNIQSVRSLNEIFRSLRKNPLCFVALIKVQQLFLSGIYYPQWNLSHILSGNLSNGIKYLDISRNDIQTIDTNFVINFPELTVLDISYNMLSTTVDYKEPIRILAWMLQILTVHPSIHVLDTSRQYFNPNSGKGIDNDLKTGSKQLLGREKRSTNTFGSYFETCIWTNLNDLITNRTLFANAFNCIMGVNIIILLRSKCVHA